MRALILGLLLPLVSLASPPIEVNGSLCEGVSALSSPYFFWSDIEKKLNSLSPQQSRPEILQCLIPKSALKNEKFMIRSRSLQHSDYKNPRVLIPILSSSKNVDWSNLSWDEEISFYSINGKYHNGGDDLEVFRFDPALPHPKNVEMIEVTLNGAKPNIARGTPKSCQKCHGLEPRYLWGEREFWSSAALGRTTQRTRSEYDEMVNAMANNPRYSWLDYKSSEGQSLQYLNFLGGKINNKRIIAKILDSPDFHRLKFAIIAAIGDCDDVSSFIPAALVNTFNGKDFLDESNENANRRLYEHVKANLLSSASNDDRSLIYKYTSEYERMIPSLKRVFLEMFEIENEKSLFGQMNNLPISPIANRTMPLLRWLFEGRGIGIADWTYDEVEGTYAIDASEIRGNSWSLFDLLVKSDEELKAVTDKYTHGQVKQGEHDLSPSIYAAMSNNKPFCDELKNLSLTELRDVKLTKISLDKRKPIAEKYWRHHFSNIDKVDGLPNRLPSNPVNRRSCNQCHFNYSANYSGPVFQRQSKSYPLTFITCANCHSDKTVLVAPYIPFNSQTEMDELLEAGYGELIKYRLGDDAKMELDHMPSVLRLKPAQRKKLLEYIRRFD